MKLLSGMDSLFLHMEQGNQYMHVAGLGIYDPSTAPGGKVRFKQILDFFARRLDSAKVFRRRLVVAPLGLDRPYWIDEGDIDTEYHVRHTALPQPGDWRQLMIQVARIHSRPLDRSRPLWEAYVIEGLDHIPGIAKGSFALYVKFHHAGVDGEAGAEIIKVIHSLSAEFSEEPSPTATPGLWTVSHPLSNCARVRLATAPNRFSMGSGWPQVWGGARRWPARTSWLRARHSR